MGLIEDMRWILLVLLLVGCSADPIPEINGTPVEAKPVVINEVERVLEVEVSEDNIPTPLSDYTYTKDMISFVNKNHEIYRGDNHALHTVESEDKEHFIVNKGHSFIVDKSGITYLLRYDSIETRKKMITFTLMTEELEAIEFEYELSQDNNTLGKGILEIEGLTFPFYIGYKAGNPLSVDMNGDRIIDGSQVMVHTKTGAEHTPKGI